MHKIINITSERSGDQIVRHIEVHGADGEVEHINTGVFPVMSLELAPELPAAKDDYFAYAARARRVLA